VLLVGDNGAMARRPVDKDREERIQNEIVVDAHDPEEQATRWFAHLEGTLAFPFLTRCIAERAISPLRVGDEVEVVGRGPEDECAQELFVLTPWERRTLAVPLMQLEVVHGEETTREAVEDWRYWVERGYQP
jgi:Calcium binding